MAPPISSTNSGIGPADFTQSPEPVTGGVGQSPEREAGTKRETTTFTTRSGQAVDVGELEFTPRAPSTRSHNHEASAISALAVYGPPVPTEFDKMIDALADFKPNEDLNLPDPSPKVPTGPRDPAPATPPTARPELPDGFVEAAEKLSIDQLEVAIASNRDRQAREQGRANDFGNLGKKGDDIGEAIGATIGFVATRVTTGNGINIGAKLGETIGEATIGKTAKGAAERAQHEADAAEARADALEVTLDRKKSEKAATEPPPSEAGEFGPAVEPHRPAFKPDIYGPPAPTESDKKTNGPIGPKPEQELNLPSGQRSLIDNFGFGVGGVGPIDPEGKAAGLGPRITIGGVDTVKNIDPVNPFDPPKEESPIDLPTWEDVASSLGVEQTWSDVKNMASKTWSGIKDLASYAWDGVKSFLGSIPGVDQTSPFDNITEQRDFGMFAVPGQSLGDFRKEQQERDTAVGKSISDAAKGAWDGIKDAAGGIADAASNVGNNIADAAKGAWGGIKDALGFDDKPDNKTTQDKKDHEPGENKGADIGGNDPSGGDGWGDGPGGRDGAV